MRWRKYPSAARMKPTVCGMARGCSLTLPFSLPTSCSYMPRALYRLFPLPWSLHLAGSWLFFLAQLACPFSVKRILPMLHYPHTPPKVFVALCLHLPWPGVPKVRAWPRLPLYPGPGVGLAPMLSGTQAMFAGIVLDSCLLGLRLIP